MAYIPKTTPYKHQVKARSASRLPNGLPKPAFAYFMEMGTGKTKVEIDEICEMYLEGLITGVLLYAPKGVYLNWPNREVPVHMPDDIAKEVDSVAWNQGGKNYKFLLSKLMKKDGRLKILYMNTEAMSSSRNAIKQCEAFLKFHAGYCMTAVDESTFIKNHDSNRTDEVVRMGRISTYRRIMTGSPVTRSPLDLYSQFDFLGAGLLGYRSYYAFRARYAIMQEKNFGGRKVKIVVNYRDIEDLNEKIQPYSYRVLKEDCLDLPPKVYVQREVEMTDEQERIYKEMIASASAALGASDKCPDCKGSGIVNINLEGTFEDFTCGRCQGTGETREGDHVTATEVITQILRLHQILCGHVMDENGVVHDVPSNRVKVMMDVIAETSGPVIIWAKYRKDIDNIVEALSKPVESGGYGPASVVQYHGGIQPAAREIASFRFQGEKMVEQKDKTMLKVFCPDAERARFMVSNPQTGGYGNTWTEASTVIYFSNDYDLEKRLQSEDRAHRSGQTKSVTYVDLYVPKTVEEKIIKALRNKINISTAIMGDGYRTWLI